MRLHPRSWLKHPCVICGDPNVLIRVMGRCHCAACATDCRLFVERIRRHEHLLNREVKRAA